MSYGKSDACPSFIFSSEFRPALKGPRNSVSLYMLDGSKKNSWKQIPLQIDPVTPDGRFEFNKDNKWMSHNFGVIDRVVFKPHDFGRRKNKKDKYPCKAKSVYEFRSLTNRKYGYLIKCDSKETPAQISSSSPVVYNTKESTVSGDRYTYAFNSKNHMLFSKIAVGEKNRKIDIVGNSNIAIRADIKNFFTFHFDADDIESYLEEVSIGPIGVNARVSFYLKVLYFFTIKLSLTTDVSFYEDSANIPMVVHIPKSAPGKLNPGSGIIYSWDILKSNSNTNKKGNIGMPMLTSDVKKLIQTDYTKLGKVGLNLCKGSSRCRYLYEMNVDNVDFLMDFTIPKKLVKLGFYPLYVKDIHEYNEPLDWDVPSREDGKTTGFYFDTTGLQDGSHSWDFWLHLGNKKGLATRCPSPIYVKTLLK